MSNTPVTCPICRLKVHQLFPIDAQLTQHIKKIGWKKIPQKICSNCYKKLSKKISGNLAGGSRGLSAHERNRALIWRNRTVILKKAQKLFEQKVFVRSIANFEKYLRIVEAANGKKEGELTPEIFNKSTRSRELTIVTSVYWHLLRIYDMNDKYEKQLLHAAEKFSAFLPYSYIYNEIIRKSKHFIKSSRNQKVFKNCFRLAKRSHKRCFIATSAFHSTQALEVVRLRQFKQEYLETNIWGRKFIDVYNKVSPVLAEALNKTSFLKPFVRGILRVLICFLPRKQ